MEKGVNPRNIMEKTSLCNYRVLILNNKRNNSQFFMSDILLEREKKAIYDS